jgi:hypothetical protein
MGNKQGEVAEGDSAHVWKVEVFDAQTEAIDAAGMHIIRGCVWMRG